MCVREFDLTCSPPHIALWPQDLAFYCCPQIPDERQNPPKRHKISKASGSKALKKRKPKDTRTKEYRFDVDVTLGVVGLVEAFYAGSGMKKQVESRAKQVLSSVEAFKDENCDADCQKSEPTRLLQTEVSPMPTLLWCCGEGCVCAPEVEVCGESYH